MLKYPISVLLLLACVSVSTMAQEVQRASAMGTDYVLTSAILGEDRAYSVYLPEECEEGAANTPCPVLYVLDGEAHFSYTTALLKKMSGGGQIPSMILVAIGNTNRTRDLTPISAQEEASKEQNPQFAGSGGGERFLDFFEQELIPEIEGRYHPLRFRLLMGHSLGGLLAIHSMATRPDLFQAYLAIDPSLWWADFQWLSTTEERLSQKQDIKSRVFVAGADYSRNHESKHKMEDSAERLAYALAANRSPNLEAKIKFFADEDHGTVVQPALYYGLKTIFSGYKIVPPAIASQGPRAVVDYYRNYLAAWGITLTPPTAALIKLADQAQSREDFPTALAFHRFNLEYHPDSAIAHYQLAKTLKAMGNLDEALVHYKRAMTLDKKGWLKDYVAVIVNGLEGTEKRVTE